MVNAKNDGSCFHSMKRGVCLLPCCRWKQFITESGVGSTPQVNEFQVVERNVGPRNPDIWRGSHVNDVSGDEALEGKVLLGKGQLNSWELHLP